LLRARLVARLILPAVIADNSVAGRCAAGFLAGALHTNAKFQRGFRSIAPGTADGAASLLSGEAKERMSCVRL
jgi:hypothetical protein